MIIRIESHHVALPDTGPATIEHFARRALRSVTHGITRVTLALRHDRAPGDGRSRTCSVRIELSGGGHVMIVDRSRSMKRAVARSLRRARRLVTGTLKRRALAERRARAASKRRFDVGGAPLTAAG